MPPPTSVGIQFNVAPTPSTGGVQRPPGQLPAGFSGTLGPVGVVSSSPAPESHPATLTFPVPPQGMPAPRLQETALLMTPFSGPVMPPPFAVPMQQASGSTWGGAQEEAHPTQDVWCPKDGAESLVARFPPAEASSKGLHIPIPDPKAPVGSAAEGEATPYAEAPPAAVVPLPAEIPSAAAASPPDASLVEPQVGISDAGGMAVDHELVPEPASELVGFEAIQPLAMEFGSAVPPVVEAEIIESQAVVPEVKEPLGEEAPGGGHGVEMSLASVPLEPEQGEGE